MRLQMIFEGNTATLIGLAENEAERKLLEAAESHRLTVARVTYTNPDRWTRESKPIGVEITLERPAPVRGEDVME